MRPFAMVLGVFLVPGMFMVTQLLLLMALWPIVVAVGIALGAKAHADRNRTLYV